MLNAWANGEDWAADESCPRIKDATEEDLRICAVGIDRGGERESELGERH